MSLYFKEKFCLYDGNEIGAEGAWATGYLDGVISKGSHFMPMLEHEAGVRLDTSKGTMSIIFDIPIFNLDLSIRDRYPTGIVRVNISQMDNPNIIIVDRTFVMLKECDTNANSKFFEYINLLKRKVNEYFDLQNLDKDGQWIWECKDNFDFKEKFQKLVFFLEIIHEQVLENFEVNW